ncbi:PDZ domain-containing protein [Lacunimicrobium album]
MPWSHPVLIQRVSAIATTMAIFTTTSLKAQEEAPKKNTLFTATAVVEVTDDEVKAKSKPTYEVNDGKITITADENTPPAELIQLIMKEMTGVKNENVLIFQNRNDAFKADAIKAAQAAAAAKTIEAKPRYVLGIEVAPIPTAVRTHLKLDHGLIVTNVAPEKPAAEAGIKPNDILVNVITLADQPAIELKASQDLAEQVTKSGEAGTTLILKIIKDGEEEKVTLTPTKEDRPSFRVFMNSTTTGPDGVTVTGVPHPSMINEEIARAMKERAIAQDIAATAHGHAFQTVPAFPATAQYGFTLPQGFKSFEEKNAELQATLEKLQAQQAELIKKLDELTKKLESK